MLTHTHPASAEGAVRSRRSARLPLALAGTACLVGGGFLVLGRTPASAGAETASALHVAKPGSSGVSATGLASIEEPLVGGKRYEFEIRVANPGSGKTTLRTRVVPGADPASGWTSVKGKPVTLRPGEERAVPVVIEVPRASTPHGHEVRLETTVLPSGSGAQAASAVISKVTFTVGQR